LPLPAAVNVHRIAWASAIGIVLYHALALFAFWPWLFSWTGLALAGSGCYLFGTLGINLCFHRLLTHRGFACPLWLERFLALIGVCCLQDTPARWVAIHRQHHQHSDEQPDPHSPLVNFFWGHTGWLFVENDDTQRMNLFERYAKDLIRDRFYRGLEKMGTWVWINLAQWVVFYVIGFTIGWLTGDGLTDGVQFGLSLLLWGVIVRTVLVWHITWSVNSVTHRWGYQNYATGDGSRNNVFVGIISNGEGWHNNHHAQPRAARHGHRWWEFDLTWITIKVLRSVGLVWDVVEPNLTRKTPEPAALNYQRVTTDEHRWPQMNTDKTELAPIEKAASTDS
jgi:stearoyl-CoA desaturase (delta-9 desaturase)